MEQAMQAIQGLFEEANKLPVLSPDEFAQWRLEIENKAVGNLTGYDCPECKNRGHIAYLNENKDIVSRLCKCMKIRCNLQYIEESGLKDIIQKCTFDRYNAAEDWQKYAKQQAMQFADNPETWLYMAGQSGAGKTHLCTAICSKILNSGRQVKYYLWRDLFHTMEQRRFREDGYFELLDEIKRTDVVYIDDFLKAPDRSKIIGMIDSAFEIINARYNTDGITILSSELYISDIYALDEATAGRIQEKSKFIQIKKESGRNYRLR